MTRLPDAFASDNFPYDRSPSTSHIEAVQGKCVLVTGAGGSIGSVLSSAVARCSPGRLVLLDSSEHGLYEVDRELRRNTPISSHVIALGSVGDPFLMAALFEQHRPQIVFHAAAHKHVSLLEQQPLEAMLNNACNTYRLADLALLHRAQHLVLVSTDKAVDPTSVMGATKRLAELVLLCMQNETTRRTIVRLGNVFGSRGSVVPLFMDQIASGGPVTVTHPLAARYFMTTTEAVQALLSALDPGYRESILVPDLGLPVRIHDLARQMIHQNSAKAIKIEFTGLRPGEKIEESLLGERESWLPRHDANLRAIQSPVASSQDFHIAMDELEDAIGRRDSASALDILQRMVPEYRPSSLALSAATAAQTPLEFRS